MTVAWLNNPIGALRRWMASLLAVRYGAMLCLVLWGCCVQLDYRRAGMTTAWLSWLGTGLTVVSFLLLVNSFYGQRTMGDKFHQAMRWIDRTAMLLMGLFVTYSAVLYVNGRFDESAPVEQQAEIVSIAKTSLPDSLFGQASLATIRPMGQPDTAFTLMLAGQEPSLLWPHEPVLVHVRAGSLGLSWVMRVEQDEEQYWHGVIRELPDAAEAWKKLTWFYFKHHRAKDAANAAQHYFALRPDDTEYACAIAGTLSVHGLHQEARNLLLPFIEHDGTYWTYDVMGAIFHKLGDDRQAERLFKSAIALDPENAQAYFELGYAYKDMGRYEDAIAMFRKALQYRPIFPEMEEQIQLLQGKIVARSR
jgi:tetratricopeptide (TPR) repeat protein